MEGQVPLVREALGGKAELVTLGIMDALERSPDLRQIRLRFSISGVTGTSSDLKILPNNIEGLQTCMSEAFTKVHFRNFKVPRQLATYTISIEPPKPADE